MIEKTNISGIFNDKPYINYKTNVWEQKMNKCMKFPMLDKQIKIFSFFFPKNIINHFYKNGKKNWEIEINDWWVKGVMKEKYITKFSIKNVIIM